MKKIFNLIILTLIFFICSIYNVLPAEWISYQNVNIYGRYEVASGWVSSDGPLCSALKKDLGNKYIRQGVNSLYTDASKTTLVQTTVGMHDCQLTKDNNVTNGLILGYSYFPEKNRYIIYYNTNNYFKFVYAFNGNKWQSYECPLKELFCTPNNLKDMNSDEIEKAKRIIISYNNLNLGNQTTTYLGNNFPIQIK